MCPSLYAIIKRGMNIVAKPKPFGIAVVIIGAIAGLGTWLFFAHRVSLDVRLVTTLTAINGPVTLGAVPLFITGLRRFTPEFRKAYRTFCIGLILFGFSQMILWLSSFTHLSKAATSGIIGLPYALSFVVQYLGLRACARVLRISTAWTSFLFLVSAALVLTPVASWVPHAPASTSEIVFDVSLVLVVWLGMFALFSAAIARRIRQAASVIYRQAMHWLLSA